MTPGTADRTEAAVSAWRSVAPAGVGSEALLEHGLRLAASMASAAELPPFAARAVPVAAVLHEVGWFVEDRGHHAVRGARWVAIRLPGMIPGVTEEERRLVGEMILFHRHRGPLPADVGYPEQVDRFRTLERRDRRHDSPPALRAVLRRMGLVELLRHPRWHQRVSHIRRPER